jgi:hypothetical protein
MILRAARECLNEQKAFARHCVSGIDREVEQCVLKPVIVAQDRRKAVRNKRLQGHAIADGLLEEPAPSEHLGSDVDQGLGIGGTAGRGKLPGQERRSVKRVKRVCQRGSKGGISL